MYNVQLQEIATGKIRGATLSYETSEEANAAIDRFKNALAREKWGSEYDVVCYFDREPVCQ